MNFFQEKLRGDWKALPRDLEKGGEGKGIKPDIPSMFYRGDVGSFILTLWLGQLKRTFTERVMQFRDHISNMGLLSRELKLLLAHSNKIIW